jgi:predicted metal-dependent phosphoesterase TrpH
MPKLKVDLHTHTGEDPKDIVHYSAFTLIDKAASLGYDAIAITNHDAVLYHPRLLDYAREKGLLLIPGMEATLSNKHVVILNPAVQENVPERNIEDLPEMLQPDSLVMAPHPFFPQRRSLKKQFISILPWLDAVELSHFYTARIDFNRKAVQHARSQKLPLVGTSDCHILWEFGTTYSVVDAEKDVVSIIQAVKKGRVEVFTAPLKSWQMAYILGKLAEIKLYHLISRSSQRKA